MTQPTYPQPAYPQPPQEPKKKRGALKVILIVVGCFVALLVLLGACVAAIGGDDTAAPPPSGEGSAASEPSPKASQPPAEKTYKIGEKATDDDYQFTVTKIKCGVSQVGDSVSNEKAQGQFCLVSLRIKNVGNDAINFSDQNQTLIDTKGKNYSPDDEAWVYTEDGNVMGEINPGNTLKTIVPFDIPKKAEPDYLLLKAGVWGASDGVKVKL
jgi:archaellum component FlaG (FlaF/FlaG flagellin family)